MAELNHGTFESCKPHTWWIDPPLEAINLLFDHWHTGGHVATSLGWGLVDSCSAFEAAEDHFEPADRPLAVAIMYGQSGGAIAFFEIEPDGLSRYGPMALGLGDYSSLTTAYTLSYAMAHGAAQFYHSTEGPAYWPAYRDGRYLTFLGWANQAAAAIAAGQPIPLRPGEQPPNQPAPVTPSADAGWAHMTDSIGRRMPSTGQWLSDIGEAVRQAIR